MLDKDQKQYILDNKNKARLAKIRREYVANNKEKVRQSKKASYEKHKHKHVERIKEYHKAYYMLNKKELLEKGKLWRANNKEKQIETRHAHYLQNKEKVFEQVKVWRENNSERYYAQAKVWRQNNPEMVCAKTAKHRATKLSATPVWADIESIKEFYLNCPKGYHVDHIVPLQGKYVCGLHVLVNLQYLTAKENQSKGNRY